MDMFLLIATVLLVAANAVGIVTASNVQRDPKEWRACLQWGLLRGGITLGLLYALYAVLCSFTICRSTAAPLLTFGIIGSLYCLWQLIKKPSDTPLFRFVDRAVLLLAGVLALELVVFNFPCYTLHPMEEHRILSDALLEYDPKTATPSGETVVVKKDGNLDFTVDLADVRYIQLDTSSEAEFYQLTCRIKDDNFSRKFIHAAQTRMNSTQDSVLFAVNSHGTLHAFQLGCWMAEDVTLQNLVLMNVKPYAFSVLRVLLLAAILIGIHAIRCFQWHRVQYDGKNFKHRMALAVLVTLSIFMMLGNYQMEQGLILYNDQVDMTEYNPYEQTLDAWLHGQIALRLPVGESLVNLENPYDHSLREATSAETQWDRAYYNGKYYSYFGIAPVIFLYYPIYLLTGHLPSMNLCCCIFGMFSVLGIFGLMMVLVEKYCKQVSLLQLLCGIIAAEAASGAFFCANFSDQYFLAFSSGICFTYLYLWLGFAATTAKRLHNRCLLLFGCAVCIALTVMSRPNMALFAMLLVPPFWELIRRTEHTRKQKIGTVASFFVPLCAGGAFVMWYNAVRFGSPFDFGITYQLTVNNIAANGVRLSALPSAIAAYILNPLHIGGDFPWIVINAPYFDNTGQYIYQEGGCGILLYPCLAVGTLLFFLYVRRKHVGLEKWLIYTMTFVLSLVILFLDYCLGGYNIRYSCDVTPALAAVCVMIILEVHQKLQGHDSIRRYADVLSTTTLLATPVFLLALLFAFGTSFAAWHEHPSLFYTVRDLLVFWR